MIDVALVALAAIGFLASLMFLGLSAWVVWDSYHPRAEYIPIEPEDDWNWAGLR